jgi:hypothetical protein
MIISQFNTDLNILDVTYFGKIEFIDLIEFGNTIYSDKSLPRNLKILTDVTKAEYLLKHSEFPSLVSALHKHISAYDSVSAAFIQNKPKETAYSMILELEAKIPNYHHAVFSTRESALNWLNT